MNKIYLIVILVFILFSCQNGQQTDTFDQNDGLDSLDIDQKIEEEKKAASTEPLHVDIYELDYDNREFPGNNGFKRQDRVLQKKQMSYFDFIALKSIINDSNSYTTVGSACFYPNIGVVVSDESSTVLSELYICLHCNNSELYDTSNIFNEVDRKDGKYGFSELARKKIRHLISTYGFETKHTYTIFYDYLDDYLDNQIQNGRDSIDVVNEIAEYHQTYKNK